MNSPTRKHFSVLRLLCGWCAVLLYAGAASSLGPGLAMVLGSLDAGHRAQLQRTPEGIRIVLHHDPGSGRHQHGPVARALTFFAQSTTTANADHVLQFGGADSPALAVSKAAPAREQAQWPLYDFACIGAVRLHLDEVAPLPTPPRPPPDAGGARLALRSTVILI